MGTFLNFLFIFLLPIRINAFEIEIVVHEIKSYLHFIHLLTNYTGISFSFCLLKSPCTDVSPISPSLCSIGFRQNGHYLLQWLNNITLNCTSVVASGNPGLVPFSNGCGLIFDGAERFQKLHVTTVIEPADVLTTAVAKGFQQKRVKIDVYIFYRTTGSKVGPMFKLRNILMHLDLS